MKIITSNGQQNFGQLKKQALLKRYAFEKVVNEVWRAQLKNNNFHIIPKFSKGILSVQVVPNFNDEPLFLRLVNIKKDKAKLNQILKDAGEAATNANKGTILIKTSKPSKK